MPEKKARIPPPKPKPKRTHPWKQWKGPFPAPPYTGKPQ